MDRDTAPENAASRGALARQVVPGALAALLMWLAFPPVGWWPLAWLAPAGWLWWAARDDEPVRRPYLWAYATGALFWLPYLQGIRLAHVALVAGWLALALYLAVYTPLFIAATRMLRRTGGLPLPLAGAIAWVGCEYVRLRFATGFGGGLLAHSQIPRPELVQSAEWCGTHGLGFLMVATCGCFVEAVRNATGGDDTARRARFAFAWTMLAVALVSLNAWFGARRYAEVERAYDDAAARADGRALRVALIQESVDTIFEFDPDRSRRTFETYRQATLAACREHGPFDLIVWPESVFAGDTPDYLGGDPRHPELRRRRLLFQDRVERLLAEINTNSPEERRTWLIGGTGTVDLDASPPREYSSALLVDADGQVATRYFKNHLVMFGEYLPGGAWFPWIYSLTPMPGGLTPGPGPTAFELRGVRLAPSICFENMVPHLIDEHVRRLTREERSPDALLTVTNDGWFWGSSILDVHFQAACFRAIEQRRPLLVAANTGLSCVVAPSGRVVDRSTHRESAVLIASLPSLEGKTLGSGSNVRVAEIGIIVGIGAVFVGFISRRRSGRSLPLRRP